MGKEAYLLIAVGAFFFALFGRKSLTGIITPPMVFLGFGLALALTGLIHGHGTAHDILHVVAEVTLVLVLFTDAAQVSLAKLRKDHQWPVRMLLVGLPLAIVFGTLLNMTVLPDWSIWEAALLAAILAPTDAALGQSVVSNPAVPERARQTLAVESGLNDGLALPAVVLFACMASATHSLGGPAAWVTFGVKQIVLGPLAGIAVGLAGANILRLAAARKWTDPSFEGIAVLALAGTSYLAADAIGGNGFIAAFVGGLCFGNRLSRNCKFAFEFAETEGRALILGAFLMVGIVLLPEALKSVGPVTLTIAILSLVAVRPLAIWLSLTGTRANWETKLFLGWFGPRGLASALFALLVLAQIKTPHANEVLMIVIVTVALSAVLHGLTAAPAAQKYGQMVRQDDDAEVMPPPAAEPAKPIKTI